MVNISERRDRQRDELIHAAEAAIAAHGAAGLKARDLAREIGCAVGAIYNLVADMDELVLRVGSRTLARLDHALAQAVRDQARSSTEAADQLVALALAYCTFARENMQLWRILFEHRMAADMELPDWSIDEQMGLFRHIAGPLAVLAPAMESEEREMLSRTLFSAVHGVVAIGLEEKLVAVPRAALERQIETLVLMVCAGLRFPTKK